MDARGRAHLTDLYRSSLARHGATARGMRWSSEAVGSQGRWRPCTCSKWRAEAATNSDSTSSKWTYTDRKDTPWYVVDADSLVLGRLAALVAERLRGKHKAMYTPSLDCGDHIVVVNAEKVALTGNKRGQKTYYRHSGYPGGIKQRTADQILQGAHPERLVEKAVQRMLPKGALGDAQLKKLHVYSGPDHPHQGQTPAALDVAARNRKNSIKKS